MNRLVLRATMIAFSGLFILMAASGCTLTGSDAPPAATAITTLPTIAPTATPKAIIPSPSPQPTVNVFGTATAIALAQGLGGTPGTPGTPVTGLGVTPGVGGATATAKPPVTPGAGGQTTTTGGGSASCPPTYTVVSGDTLFRIALRFGMTVQELAAANGISNAEFISVGQTLKIPKCGGAATSSGTTGGAAVGSGVLAPQGDDTVAANGDILHTVKSGENLFRIALSYGLSWEVVAKYNGITNPNAISVGEVIRIPTK